MASVLTPGSIDLVLDQHSGALRDGALALAPRTEQLLKEASQLHVPVRIVVSEPLDDPAIADLEALLALGEAALALDELELPDAPGPHVLVAADRIVRREAADRGWQPVPHPALALPVLLGERLQFARLTGTVEALRGVVGLVPYWIEQAPDGSSWAFAALTGTGLAAVLDAGLGIERLALDVHVEDPLLVQLDAGARRGRLASYEVLWADALRVLLALDAQTDNDSIPAHGAHGHFRFLTPSPELLAPATLVASTAGVTGRLSLQAPVAPASVSAASFAADVARYAGLAPLDAAGAVQSRHSSHPDNARAVDALLAELTELGYAPTTHEFAFGGRILRNVIADRPGSGELGDGAGIVVVGCHLDSTAARDPGYVPRNDPARGADDDASGMAALLAIARHLPTLPDPLLHTVRFCFFNAEESGLVGSRAYAASLKAARAPIAAVVCCDMIGWNSDRLRTFEVHAGFTNPAVRDISVPLARVVADAAATFGVLAPAQIYTGTTPTGGTDPTRFDGAINRSDHASFHEQGYPAVLVSEDFFPNPPGDAAADPNPNYHQNADAVIDADYAADIVRAVSVAVIELASG